ncbi:hypothetical protein AB0K20_32575 [Micromonospora matsumotoense]|uniref:hypothetical protein n=1 Tax=Micromonospora matsumotoense TaxID=121616 RepID=UPI00341D5401
MLGGAGHGADVHEAETGLSRELEKLVAERPGSAGVPCPHGIDGGVDRLSVPPDPDFELHPEKPLEDGMNERVAYFGIRGIRQLLGHRPRLAGQHLTRQRYRQPSVRARGERVQVSQVTAVVHEVLAVEE